MAVKASTQVSLVDITDAYNVILTSESYTFMGDSVGAPSGLSCTTQVVAYCGGSPCKVTVGNIICPSGITASVTSNGSVSPTITFRTTATVTASCEATIPVNVDGVTVNKKFSFAVAKEGYGFGWNLILGTKDFTQDANHWIIASGWSRSVDSDEFTVISYARTGATGTTWNRAIASPAIYAKDMSKGITVSFDFMCDDYSDLDDGRVCSLQTYNKNNTRIGWLEDRNILSMAHMKSDRSLKDGEWVRLTTTFSEKELKTCMLGDYSSADVAYTSVSFQLVKNGSVHIRKVKLEFGSVATPWTPHPDDLKGQKGDTGATGKTALQPNRNYNGTYTTIGQTAIAGIGDFNRTPVVGDTFTNLDGSSNTGTWQVTAVSGSNVTIKLLSYVNSKGQKGDTGKGISSTAVTYQESSSGTTIPTGTWQSSVPSVSAGQYLWTRTVITYSDNTTSTSYSVGRMGTNGSNGSAGKGIKSTSVTYQAGASGTTVPTGTWSSSVTATSASAPYLWTRTIFTYTDNTTSTSYSVGSTPEGISVGGRNLARATSADYTTPYTNFNGNANICPSVGRVYIKGLNAGDIITVRIIYKYTNIVAASGKTAYCWLQGSGNVTDWNGGTFPGGASRINISGSGEKEIVYQAKIDSYQTTNDYWNVSIRHDYVQSGSVQWKEFKVEKGNIATDWTPAPEDSIASVDVEYYLSTSAASLSGGSWSTTAPAWVNGKYMWSRTVTTDGAGNKTYSPNQNGVCIAGAKGDTGAKGDKGDTGGTGKGVKSIVEQYYKSTSATSQTGGSWSTTYPGWENGKYIWTRSVITYSDNTTSTTTAVCVSGMKGDTGAKGDKGDTGSTGATGPQGPQGAAGKDANQVVHTVKGNGEANLYVEFATVKITGAYCNHPTMFKINGREYEATDVQFSFMSENVTDPSLAFIRATGGFSVWMYKKTTSTWGIITKLNEPWGSIYISNFIKGNCSYTVTWTSTKLASLPSGVIAADQLQAAKTATNFMEFTSGTGLQIGDKTNGSWKGFRTKITSTAFEILNEVGTAVASYGRKLIELGKDATDAVISLCGGKGIIKYEQVDIYDKDKSTLTVSSENVGLIADDTTVMKTATIDGEGTRYTSNIYATRQIINLDTITTLSDGTVVDVMGVLIRPEGIFLDTGSGNETFRGVCIDGIPLLDLFFPVGYIYLAYNDSESPAEKFGGEWEQITGKFLYCDTGTATGGSTKHRHVQTVGLDYAAGYLYANSGNKVTGSRVVTGQMCSYKYDGYGASASTREDSTYESYHTPQYITVYAWRRTA